MTLPRCRRWLLYFPWVEEARKNYGVMLSTTIGPDFNCHFFWYQVISTLSTLVSLSCSREKCAPSRLVLDHNSTLLNRESCNKNEEIYAERAVQLWARMRVHSRMLQRVPRSRD